MRGGGACDAAVALSPEVTHLRPSLLPLVFSRSSVELPFAAVGGPPFSPPGQSSAPPSASVPPGSPLEKLARWLEQRARVES